MKKLFLISTLLLIAAFGNELLAQCAMCTVVAEEAMKDGSSQGAGINKAVLFLFSMPYLVIGTIGYMWWKRKSDAQKQSHQ